MDVANAPEIYTEEGYCPAGKGQFHWCICLSESGALPSCCSSSSLVLFSYFTIYGGILDLSLGQGRALCCFGKIVEPAWSAIPIWPSLLHQHSSQECRSLGLGFRSGSF